MHLRKLLPLLSLAMITPAATALTEDGKLATRNLIVAMEKKIESYDEESGDDFREVAKLFMVELQSAIEHENSAKIEDLLVDYSGSFESDEISSTITKVRKCLLDENETVLKSIGENLGLLIDKLPSILLAAKTPSDLDHLLVELSKDPRGTLDPSEFTPSTPLPERLKSQQQSIKSFVVMWQDLLQARKLHDKNEAIRILQSLSRLDDTLFPRSQILDFIQREKLSLLAGRDQQILDIVTEVKTLGETRQALQMLSEIVLDPSEHGTIRLVTEYSRSLGYIEKVYREHLAGIPFNIEAFQLSITERDTPASANLDIIRLQAELLTLVLPRYLGCEDISPLLPGEPPHLFMKRALDAFRKRGDIPGVLRVIVSTQIFTRGQNTNQPETAGLQEYLSAQLQFEAGEFVPAVISLQNALASGNSLLPSVKIGEQLSSIKKNHPEDYVLGMSGSLPSIAFPRLTSPSSGFRKEEEK